MRRLVLTTLAALAAACGGSGGSGNWLTDPGVAGHSRFFPLVGTAHDISAPGATFSCEGCHTDPNTFANPQCTTACHSQAATDPIHTGISGYQYTTPSCLASACHKDGGTPAPPDHDTKDFPRATGTKHGAVTCSQCHTDRTAPTNPANFACASCHAARPGFSTAHAKVTGVTGATASADCLKCHGDSQVNTVAAHTKFPIAAGSGTHDTVCLQCHTAMRTDKVFAANFGTFDCLTCHAHSDPTATGTIHAGVQNYVYASPNCYGCHTNGTTAPLDHDTRFFPGAFPGSAHNAAGVTCSQCHTDPQNPRDPTKFACGTCHLQRDASLVTKHTNPASAVLRVASSEISTSNSATCLRCHADSQVTTTHVTRVTTSAGRTISLPHENAQCLECHDVPRTDKPFGIDFQSDPQLASKVGGRKGCYHCHRSAPPSGD